MFLKIATILAILGLLMSLLLSVLQQALIMSRLYYPSIQLAFRFLTIGQSLAIAVPLIIFFVAFLLSLKPKHS